MMTRVFSALAIALVLCLNKGNAQTTAVIYATTTLATFPSGPSGVAIDPSGIIYVTVGNALEKVSPSGTVSIIAGSLSVPGSADGTGVAAQFNTPTGIATDTSGNIYVADSGNNAIRKVTPTGVVTTLAGLISGNSDGTGIAAQFNDPVGVAVDLAGNVYVADSANTEVRKVSPTGVTTTILTSANLTFAGAGAGYYVDEVTLDGAGNLYVGIVSSNRSAVGAGRSELVYYDSVIKVSATGTQSIVYQILANDFLLNTTSLGGLAVDANSNVYLGIPGAPGAGGVSSGGIYVGTGFIVNLPCSSMAVDSSGRLYVCSGGTLVRVTPGETAPTITTQPIGGAIAYGASITLSVASSGTPTPTYQWQLNGVNIAGATAATYTTSVPGSYAVVVTNPAGSVTSTAVNVTAATRLVDISSRALVGTGGNVMIAGFIVSGPPGSTEQVLIRGVGPALAQFGLTGLLAQPVLTLFSAAGTVIATNTGWGTNSNSAQIAAAFTATGAFALPLDSADSALLVSLPPGSYTAEVSGLNGTEGVALAEVYEITSGNPELINISTRALVTTGPGVAIAGIVVTGTQSAKLLIRAVGPALTQFGVSGVLTESVLNVVNSAGVTVASNIGWSSNSNAAAISSATAAVGAFALPVGSPDCALLITLPPGAYTAVVSGIGGRGGVALVEAYQVP